MYLQHLQGTEAAEARGEGPGQAHVLQVDAGDLAGRSVHLDAGLRSGWCKLQVSDIVYDDWVDPPLESLTSGQKPPPARLPALKFVKARRSEVAFKCLHPGSSSKR